MLFCVVTGDLKCLLDLQHRRETWIGGRGVGELATSVEALVSQEATFRQMLT